MGHRLNRRQIAQEAVECRRRSRLAWWGGRNPPYGWEPLGDCAVKVTAEQLAIGKMRAWRKQGRSYRWIAENLRSRGILTKTGLIAWHPAQVRKILELDALLRCEI